MKKALKIPQFKNEDQERQFWDKVDLSDYFQPSDFKPVNFPNLDIPHQSLIKQYISHGLNFK